MKKESINPEMIKKLQKKHPGMSRYIFSMTRKPDYYGIDLTQAARKLAGKKPKKEEHRERPFRLYLRLSAKENRALTELLNGRTKQEYLHDLVIKELEGAKDVYL